MTKDTSPQEDRKWALPFFTIWTGQALSMLGSQLGQFALVWWITETTGSATVLATATLVAVLPNVVLGPVAGALVDRWNRRRCMIVADTFIALVSLGLAVLFWRNALQVWHIYVVMIARALGGIFHHPAMQASTSLMAPKSQLPRIAGMNQTLFGALNIVAPPLGALFLSWMPLHMIMGIDVLTAVLAIAPLLFVAIPQPERAPQAAPGAGPVAILIGDVKAGFKYIWSWPGLLAVCVLAMFLNFFVSPAMEMMPLLVTNHFAGAALQLGWLNSAWGIGLLTGGVALTAWGGGRRRIVAGLLGIIGLGVGVLVVGFTPATFFPLAVGGLFFGGAMNALCNGSFNALVQQVVAPEVQGRVFTVIGSLCAAMMPLSMAITGPLADAIGVRPLYWIGGLAQIILGIAGFLIPAIMDLENNHQVASVALRPAPVAVEVSAE
ncbi:MAG: MFS transporter [Anaerolineae bacterium]|nr:MFS transporter [Anaerolineae bacterium]